MTIALWRAQKRRLASTLAVTASAGLAAGVLLASADAQADTTPPPGVPATVSLDPLPTVQINGVAWNQVIVGNTVYVAGRFTSARPAGAPLGSYETPRANLLAFNLTTGELLPFNHVLNQQAVNLTASPDGKRLYVVGNFTKVDGEQHVGFAAFDLTTDSLVSSFKTDLAGAGHAVQATNSKVYVGGTFTKAKGVARTNLAAFDASGALLPWAPVPTGIAAGIESMLITPNASKIVISGRFTALNGITDYGLDAVDPTTGANVAWASQKSNFPIRDASKTAAITSLSTDGQKIYITGYAYGGGNFEGTAAISPTDGSIIWIADCHGDTYSAFPASGVLYSVGHAHECAPAGGFPETSPRTWHRALASSTDVIHAGEVNGPATYHYTSFQGWARPTQLNWYPNLTVGNSTGSGNYQAAWSVAATTKYVVLAGEFQAAEGVAQQGLVRYAISSSAPNKIGPRNYRGFPVTAATADADGKSEIFWPTTFDKDNSSLTYKLYRDSSATPVSTQTVSSLFYSLSKVTFTDSGLVPGSNHYYRLSAIDPYGNSTVAYNLFNDGLSNVVYTGNWSVSTGRGLGDYGDDVHSTTDNGASASVQFSGTSISVVSEKSSDQGVMSVSIDGGAPIDVDTTASTRAVSTKVFTTTGLSKAAHTITVTKASGTYMLIDGFYAPGGIS